MRALGPPLLDERLHEQREARLLVGPQLRELADRALGGVEVGRVERERRRDEPVQRGEAQVVELLPALADPRAVELGQVGPAEQLRGHAGRADGRLGVAGRERGLGGERRALGRLDVDPRVGGQQQREVVAAAHEVLAEDAAQLEQPALEPVAVAPGGAEDPRDVDGPRAVRDEVGGEQARLGARQRAVERLALDLDAQSPAEFDLQ